MRFDIRIACSFYLGSLSLLQLLDHWLARCLFSVSHGVVSSSGRRRSVGACCGSSVCSGFNWHGPSRFFRAANFTAASTARLSSRRHRRSNDTSAYASGCSCAGFSKECNFAAAVGSTDAESAPPRSVSSSSGTISHKSSVRRGLIAFLKKKRLLAASTRAPVETEAFPNRQVG